jgi:Trp operon repressor
LEKRLGHQRRQEDWQAFLEMVANFTMKSMQRAFLEMVATGSRTAASSTPPSSTVSCGT